MNYYLIYILNIFQDIKFHFIILNSTISIFFKFIIYIYSENFRIIILIYIYIYIKIINNKLIIYYLNLILNIL